MQFLLSGLAASIAFLYVYQIQATEISSEYKNAGGKFVRNGEQKLVKRYVPLHVGLAANPDVLTEDPINERRSLPQKSYGLFGDHVEQKLKKRYLPLHVGLAANPNLITEDNIVRAHRSLPENVEARQTANQKLIMEATSIREHRSLPENFDAKNRQSKNLELHKRYLPLHVGLAANPDVLTEDPVNFQSSSEITKKMRRSVKNSEINFSQPLEVDTKLNLTLTQDNNSQKEPFLLLAKDSSHSNKDPPLNLKTVGSSKAVSFPLFRRSSHEWEEDVHPEIRYQQHINNALRRHANFLGKPIEESLLVENIYKGAEGLGLKHSDLRRRGGSLIPRQNELSVGYPRSAFASAKSGTVTPAIPVTAANSIGLSIEANDVGYFAEILVGTPPAKFKVVVDTGSSDFWLMLEECHNLKDQASSCNHPTLKSTSSTFKKTTNKFKVTYGTGKVDGVLVEETLNLGGLTLNNHVFGGVTAASDEFTGKNVPFDGLLGTAKSVLSNQKVLTPVEALTKAGLLSGSFVGYAIGRVSDTQNIGQVTFGGIDQTKFNGDLTLFPNVNKKGFWEGVMSTVTVDGATVLNQRTGILDTGTTLILAPPADVQAVHAAIPGSVPDKKGNFKIPCTTRSKVGLTFGGVNFEINPVDLTFQPAGKNLTGLCISGISAGTVGGPAQWLVGDVFLKSVYFATDIPNDQMGLAVLNRVPPKDG